MDDSKVTDPKGPMPTWYWVVGLLVLAGAGWLAWSMMNAGGEQRATSLDSNSITPEQHASADTIQPIDSILLAAQPALQTATVLGAELETEDGIQLYKLTLSDGRVLRFNALTGASLAATKNELSADIAARTALPKGLVYISFDAARAIATAKRPSVDIKTVELEIEEGVPVYSAKFVDEGRVDVNAVTGVITRVKEPGATEVKTNNDDFDKDGTKNQSDQDVDGDGISNNVDTDSDNDTIEDAKDQNDDNDGVNDSEDSDKLGSDHSGSDSSNSGSGKNN